MKLQGFDNNVNVNQALRVPGDWDSQISIVGT
jgi:hypothetical protein